MVIENNWKKSVKKKWRKYTEMKLENMPNEERLERWKESKDYRVNEMFL